MDAETRSALLTLAKAIQDLSEEAATVLENQYGDDHVTKGVNFPMQNKLSDLIDRLQAADARDLPPAGGR